MTKINDMDPTSILQELIRMTLDGSVIIERIDYQSAGPNFEEDLAMFIIVVRDLRDKDQ